MAYNSYSYPYGGNYNPVATYMPPIQAQNMQSIIGNFCRPVATKEEAATAQVPFDGNPYVFPNLQHGEIYVKQFNINTGSTDFATYRREDTPQTVSYATTAELEALRAEIRALRTPEVTGDE